MLEISLKVFVFRLEFFHHKFEILDAIVVVVSFVLDLILLFKNHHFEALGLLILLRLWRVARIINGESPVLAGYTGWGQGGVLRWQWQYSHQIPRISSLVCVMAATSWVLGEMYDGDI